MSTRAPATKKKRSASALAPKKKKLAAVSSSRTNKKKKLAAESEVDKFSFEEAKRMISDAEFFQSEINLVKKWLDAAKERGIVSLKIQPDHFPKLVQGNWMALRRALAWGLRNRRPLLRSDFLDETDIEVS